MTDCVYKTKSGKRKQFDGGIGYNESRNRYQKIDD